MSPTCKSKNTMPIWWHEFFQECIQEQVQPDGHIYSVIWLTESVATIFDSAASISKSEMTKMTKMTKKIF